MADLDRWKAAIPWTPVRKDLAASRVALVSSGGLSLPGQEPFDLSAAVGDASYRVIPAHARLDELRVSHLDYDPTGAGTDAGVMLPLAALESLRSQGKVGAVAPRHISFSGAIPDPSPLVSHSAPEIADIFASDEVDLVFLAPA
jgi:D-proline reductase (dithiol) PrdB